MARPEHVHLELLHSFGSVAYTDIKNTVCLSDDDTNSVIYPVGRHIAVRNLETDDINYIRVYFNLGTRQSYQDHCYGNNKGKIKTISCSC